jgi:hypothetical protein
MLGWPPATSHNEHYLTFMFHSAIFELEIIKSGVCAQRRPHDQVRRLKKKALAAFSTYIRVYFSVHFGRGKLVQLSQLCAGNFFDEASRSRHSRGKLTFDWLQ